MRVHHDASSPSPLSSVWRRSVRRIQAQSTLGPYQTKPFSACAAWVRGGETGIM